MKTKKGLWLVVLLLAISSLMAAMSYSSATVTSAMTGTVKSTTDSLLALNKGDHNAARIEDGVLKIDFNQGNKTSLPVTTYGVQKDSEYIWNGLFSVKNNSENVVAVSIKTENNPANGVSIFVRAGKGDWQQIDSTRSAKIDNLPIAFKTNGQHEAKIDVKVVVAKGASLGNFNPNIVVTGEAVNK
ncbi:hypothetical protein HNO89_000572 [Sporosarcina luteola]|nr:hypothetical protein [Sporosarcina luteola]